MRNKLAFLFVLLAAAAFMTGCSSNGPKFSASGMEKKFGRGMRNATEIVRWGEFRRTSEQSALFYGPDYAYSTGWLRGFNRTLARTGVGIYEMVTAPIPSYDPVLTHYLAPGPVYPDNYTPNLLSDSMYATDTNLGFSGGDVAPFIPGSRFRVFDTH